MLITKFDPFKQIRELEKSFYNQSKNEGVSAFVPTVNTREGEFAYHVDVDLPGVKKEDIKITINKDNIRIVGQSKVQEESDKKRKYYYKSMESSFEQSFNLPTQIDPDKAEADFKNGVLTVKLPKTEEVKPKEIKIS